jgi:hypothetical protein
MSGCARGTEIKPGDAVTPSAAVPPVIGPEVATFASITPNRRATKTQTLRHKHRQKPRHAKAERKRKKHGRDVASNKRDN